MEHDDKNQFIKVLNSNSVQLHNISPDYAF